MRKPSLSSEENIPCPSLSIRPVSNCIVTRSQLVATILGVHPDCLFENLPMLNRAQMNVVAAASVFKNRLRKLDDRPDYFHLMNVWSLGYHHWLAEVCVKFILFESEIRKGLILVPKNRPRFISEFLEMFEFHNLLETSDNVFVKQLNIVTNPYSGHFKREHLVLLRDAIISKVGTRKLNAGRKVYVSRANARARKVINEAAVADYLKSQGFERVELDNVPFIDQVRLFTETSVLVSIHGAALTNAIFMPPNSSVVELYPSFENRERELNGCYKRLCSVFDHEHQFVFGTRVQIGRRPDFHVDNITINISDLESALNIETTPFSNKSLLSL